MKDVILQESSCKILYTSQDQSFSWTPGGILCLVTEYWILCLVTQFCPTLCHPMDYCLPGSFVHGQEYWSGLPCPPSGDLPNPEIKPRSPSLQADSLPTEPPGKPKNTGVGSHSRRQGFYPTQESNWGLLHRRWILYQLGYQGSPERGLWGGEWRRGRSQGCLGGGQDRALRLSGPQDEEDGQAREESRLPVLATPGRSQCWSLKQGNGEEKECQPQAPSGTGWAGARGKSKHICAKEAVSVWVRSLGDRCEAKMLLQEISQMGNQSHTLQKEGWGGRRLLRQREVPTWSEEEGYSSQEPVKKVKVVSDSSRPRGL